MNLSEQYKISKYKFQGNGQKSVKMLKEAFENVSENNYADYYGNGKIIENFEKKFADILGKEAAVFMPSGTMAQQIALRIYADEKNNKKIAYHPLSHMEVYENDAVRILHHLEPVIVGEPNRIFTLDELMAVKEDIGSLLIELPQRELGGVLPEFDELNAISEYARKKDIRIHLDGARLLETLPYYKKNAAQICECFDSVYISFYKGIGAIAGAILAGKKEFIDKAKIWKRRHGGDLISLYPYIITADYFYEKRKDKIKEYCSNAIELASYFNELSQTYTAPKVPMTNMFHVYVQKNSEELSKIISEIYNKYDVAITNHIVNKGEELSKFEISIGDEYLKIPKDLIKEVMLCLKKYM